MAPAALDNKGEKVTGEAYGRFSADFSADQQPKVQDPPRYEIAGRDWWIWGKIMGGISWELLGSPAVPFQFPFVSVEEGEEGT